MNLQKLISISFIIFTIILQSCSTETTLNYQKDPDFSIIKQGNDREEVEFQLGSPKEVLSQGSNTTAVYEYELSREPIASRDTVYGVMDVLTLGIWELINNPKNTRSEIQITYDHENKIKEVKRKKIEFL